MMLLYFAKKTHLQRYFVECCELLPKNTPLLTGSKSSSFLYIAHAGGGLNNSTYLNTLEAIERSYKLGVNFIEVDINYTLDSVIVLSHDFVRVPAAVFLQDRVSGTHLSLKNLLKWLSDSNVYLITDIKADNLKILRQVTLVYPGLVKKIIPQAYSICEINSIIKMGFNNVIFTNYVAGYTNSTIKKLAQAKCLFAITLPYDINFKLMQYSGQLQQMPTPILTHTINDPNLTKRLQESGCKGIYSDFILLPSVN